MQYLYSWFEINIVYSEYVCAWIKNKIRYILMSDFIVMSQWLETLPWGQNFGNKLLPNGTNVYKFRSYKPGTMSIIK